MAKKLSEMSLEELWRLFPIFLVPHNDAWNDWYREESSALLQILPNFKFYHVGSTAVPGIYAKNIVDILGVGESLSVAADALCHAGWICMNKSESRISLNKGYTESGFAERVFHLHLRLQGDEDEVYFRDYLRAHPETAKEYETLKLSLWKKFEFNRDAYTEAKTEFVRNVTALAKIAVLR